VILLHGRGASAEDILSLAYQFDLPQLAYFAPQAAGHEWYPNSFLAPLESNEPWLSSALSKIQSVLQMAGEAGFPPNRVVIGGFSQGACLSTEFAATHPQRYAGLIALTGGLVGPLGSDLNHTGDLAGTPAFLGSGDPDPHVPWSRVQESALVLTGMGAIVTARRYPGRGHTVSRDELLFAKGMLLDAFFATP
jgi:predicted esterase